MVKLFYFLFFTFILSFQSITQTTGWEKIYLKNIGHIDMPPTMQVQSGKYKVLVDEFLNIYGYDVAQLVIQQKGLNEFGKDAFEKYARIIIETEVGKQGDFEKLNFDINSISSSDLSEMDKTFKPGIIQSIAVTGSKLVDWFPTTIEKLNGYSLMHVSYKRQLNDRPIVMVNMYLFMNNDRKFTVTMSYRISEENYWKTDLEKALNSFVITSQR